MCDAWVGRRALPGRAGRPSGHSWMAALTWTAAATWTCPQAADSDEDEWGSSGEDAADEPEEAEDDADAAADPIGERACRSHRAPLIGAAYFWLGLAAAFWSYASIGAPRSSSDGGPSVLQILPVRATLGQHRLSGLTGQRA